MSHLSSNGTTAFLEFLRTDDLESTPAPPPRRARVANAAAQTRRDRLPPGLDERPGGVKRSYNRKESPPAPEGGAARGYSETLEGIKVLSRALAPAFRPRKPRARRVRKAPPKLLRTQGRGNLMSCRITRAMAQAFSRPLRRARARVRRGLACSKKQRLPHAGQNRIILPNSPPMNPRIKAK